MRERALSLTEVLVAMALFAIVALGIAGLLARSMAVSASGFADAVLVSETRRALEELQAMPFDHPLLEPGDGEPRPYPSFHEQQPPGIELHYQVECYLVEEWTDVAGPVAWRPAVSDQVNLKRITVTARPAEGRLITGLRALTLSMLKVPR